MSDPLRPEETDGGVRLDCRECGGPPGFHQETCSYYKKGRAVYHPPTVTTRTESFAHGFGGMNADTKVNQACVSPMAPNSAGSFRKATPEEAGKAGEAAAAHLSAVFPANTTIAHQWDESGERCKICGAKDWMGGLCSPKKAFVQPVPVDAFQECDTCRAKPGMPPLCAACLHNRDAIEALKKERDDWKKKHDKLNDDVAGEYHPEFGSFWGPEGIGGKLTRDLEKANEKLAYLHSIGLRLGMMKTSNKPEPYLAHYWAEESDEHRMFLEWSHSIG